MNLIVSNTTIIALVFARLVASIGLNPIFGRRNVPVMLRIGFAGILTLLVAPLVEVTTFETLNEISFIFNILLQILVGYTFAYIFVLFQNFLFFVGDLLDFHFGLSMAKVFDPATALQVSSVGNIIQILFITMFFVSGSHHHFIRIIILSFEYIPLFENINVLRLSSFILNAFLEVFMIVIKLGLPYIFVLFILEIAMGILMKLIPQIHVFVINIQLKIFAGLVLLMLLLQPMASFIDRYVRTMIQALQSLLMSFI